LSLILSDNNLAVRGTSGAPYGAYQLLGSTNLIAPVEDWDVITTGVFDPVGNFDLTNSEAVVQFQQFFRMRLLP
jgi:hypothetical protein